jgi:rubrerythrin
VLLWSKYVCSVADIPMMRKRALPKSHRTRHQVGMFPEDFVCPLCGAAKDMFSED